MQNIIVADEGGKWLKNRKKLFKYFLTITLLGNIITKCNTRSESKRKPSVG